MLGGTTRKTRFDGWVVAGMLGMLACSTGGVAQAQSARVTPGAAPYLLTPDNKRVLIIRHMPKLNRVKQTSPMYATTAARTAVNGKPREWAVFEVTYDTTPEWVDEVVVTYYLMVERRGADAKKGFSFYQTTVRYVDVASGEHTACAVLPPAALLRNGDQFIGFAIEFTSADGALLDVKSEMAAGSTLPVEWWKKPEVTESKSVVRRDGLVDRSKTPFGFVNIDDYEAVK